MSCIVVVIVTAAELVGLFNFDLRSLLGQDLERGKDRGGVFLGHACWRQLVKEALHILELGPKHLCEPNLLLLLIRGPLLVRRLFDG